MALRIQAVDVQRGLVEGHAVRLQVPDIIVGLMRLPKSVICRHEGSSEPRGGHAARGA